MENIKFDKLWKNFKEAQSREAQLDIMKAFMLNASYEELLAWNRYLDNEREKVSNAK
jgi:hypothetical protein